MREGTGYALRVAPAAVDAERFVEPLVRRLRSLADDHLAQASAAGVSEAHADNLHRRRKAMLAAATALDPDPLAAFPEVAGLTRTIRLRRDNDDYLSLEVLNICYRHISRKSAAD
ncbi:hypothetical protein ACWEN6_03660 [Sphaerisporangium sp. NPDC004334]